MKTIFLSILFILVGVGFFVWIIQHVGLSNVVRALGEFPLWGIAVVIALTFISFCVGILRWQRILKYQGIVVSYRALSAIWLAGFTFSYITPIAYVGGEVVRTGLLKSRFGISSSKGFSSIAIDKILEGTIWVIIIASGVLVFLVALGVPSLNKVLFVGAGVVVFSAGVIVLVYILSFQRVRVVRRVLKVFGLENSYGGIFLTEVEHDVLKFFRISNKALWEGLAFSLFKNAILWSRILFVVVLLGKGFKPISSFIMLSFSFLGYSAPIPGGLGTHEIAQSVVFAGLGLGAESGIALSLFLRMAEIIFVILGLFFLFRFGVEFLATNVIKLISKIRNR